LLYIQGNVSAQVEYSSVNSRWHFPSLYHSKSFTAEDGTTLDVILIDTVDLAGALCSHCMRLWGHLIVVHILFTLCSSLRLRPALLDLARALHRVRTGATGGASPEEDASYFAALPPRPRQAAADQWAWIEAQLAASTAQYIFVGGHYSL
jgi:hypothetical protein